MNSYLCFFTWLNYFTVGIGILDILRGTLAHEFYINKNNVYDAHKKGRISTAIILWVFFCFLFTSPVSCL